MSDEPTMRSVTIHEAKTTLSRLVAAVEQGEEIVIHRGHVPVARLVPVAAPIVRTPGRWKGQFTVPASFFDALPASELQQWEGDDGAGR